MLCARFAPDGRRIVTGAADGLVRAWTRSGQLLRTASHEGPVNDVVFAGDGERVLTASDEMRDVNRAYQLGANSFLVKPVDFAHFVEVTQALKGYWLWISKEPQIARAPMVDKTEKT